MPTRLARYVPLFCAFALASLCPANAQVYHFSTGNPDGAIATASGPPGPSQPGTETADDFVLVQETDITGGTFTGLLPANSTSANVGQIVLEIYRVFPLDSTSPASGTVPTRANSPSDVAFASLDSTAGDLSVIVSTLSTNFSVANSVFTVPSTASFQTLGDGPVTGVEVLFSFSLSTPLDLPAGHYFFVPQVQLSDGTFLWLSAPRPIVSPGTPFPAGSTDLQSWFRTDALDPDWVRVGTDVIGSGTFNAAFSLNGISVPEPATWLTMLAGFVVLGLAFRRRNAPQSAQV